VLCVPLWCRFSSLVRLPPNLKTLDLPNNDIRSSLQALLLLLPATLESLDVENNCFDDHATESLERSLPRQLRNANLNAFDSESLKGVDWEALPPKLHTLVVSHSVMQRSKLNMPSQWAIARYIGTDKPDAFKRKFVA
jgi:Leucine-rich repeat (LRR) protein